MKAILLSGKKAAGRVVIIDDRDLPLVSGYRWRLHETSLAGHRPTGPYAITFIPCNDGRRHTSLLIHKLITGWPITDHKNHDGLDNRRANLRPATSGQNSRNQRPQAGTSSRYKGVAWHRRVRKWHATITINGHTSHLGYFASEVDAGLAYNAAAIELHGEFACLNQIEDAA